MKNLFDARDIIVFSGIALMGVGGWMIYHPLGFAVPGMCLFWLGTRR